MSDILSVYGKYSFLHNISYFSHFLNLGVRFLLNSVIWHVQYCVRHPSFVLFFILCLLLTAYFSQYF